MFPTDFETEVTMENQFDFIDKKVPFRILFLGDWSGRESRSALVEPPKFKPLEIDRDNFDEIMHRLSVNLSLSFHEGDNNNLSLKFSELDDFHPDQIFQKLPVFYNLRDIRKKLLNSDTFNEAAKEVNSWLTDNETEKSDANEPAEIPVNIESNENLLDQILAADDENDVSPKGQNVQKSELSEFVSRLVKPHIVQTDLSEQSKLLLIVDEVVSDLMRKILHHPQFQALESAWRGLYFLVRRVETDSNLKIYLTDITKSELSDNIKSSDDLTATSFFELIESGISGNLADNEPWTIIGGNYSFSLNLDDVACLLRMAKTVGNANAPFISSINLETVKPFIFKKIEASDRQERFENSAEFKLWTTLRATPEADYLGLISPRFLMRLPYGEQTDPTESFAFEEVLNFEESENYLWANPAFACILMLAQTFSQHDWDISANFNPEINNLPMHFYQEANETKNIPCTEITFSERNCEMILNEGIMPRVSFRSSDIIRRVRLLSIANPISELGGNWN